MIVLDSMNFYKSSLPENIWLNLPRYLINVTGFYHHFHLSDHLHSGRLRLVCLQQCFIGDDVELH